MWFLANHIDNEGKKRLVPLSACGARASKLKHNNALETQRLQLQRTGNVGAKSSQPETIHDCSVSNSTPISVAAFMAELRQLLEHCDFGGILDENENADAFSCFPFSWIPSHSSFPPETFFLFR